MDLPSAATTAWFPAAMFRRGLFLVPQYMGNLEAAGQPIVPRRGILCGTGNRNGVPQLGTGYGFGVERVMLRTTGTMSDSKQRRTQRLGAPERAELGSDVEVGGVCPVRSGTCLLAQPNPISPALNLNSHVLHSRVYSTLDKQHQCFVICGHSV